MIALPLLLAVAACGEHKADKRPATQVAVKVNGSEISVHQINAVLASAQGVTVENADRARRDILDRLIEQQLAYDQALEKKLDRSPEVMMATEGARREIVARAYLDQLTAGLPLPGEEDAAEYYKANPALFSARKIYRLQVLELAQDEAALTYVRQGVASGRPLEEMLAWLKSHGVAAALNTVVKPAEQLPLGILPRLHEARDGKYVLDDSAPLMTVWRLLSAHEQPISLENASGRIRQFLHNQQVQQAIAADLQRLKAAAKIEFQGEFVAAKGAGGATAAPLANAGAANMEKGVAGLK